MVVIAQHLNAEQEGYAMYFLGGDLGQNPYMDITEEYFAWEKGWNNAYNEDHLVK